MAKRKPAKRSSNTTRTATRRAAKPSSVQLAPLLAPAMKISKGQQLAGFWVRFGAFVIDFILLSLLWMIVPLMLGPLVFLVIQIYLIYKYGYSVGKRVFNLKIQKQDGSPLEIVDIILREIVGKFISTAVFMLGFLLIAIDDRKQGLHDKIAHTIVTVN